MNESALLRDTGHRASMSHILLQVQVVVDLKCIFKKNTQLWCKGFQCSKMFRRSSAKMNLSKHLHSAISRNYQTREGVTLRGLSSH